MLERLEGYDLFGCVSGSVVGIDVVISVDGVNDSSADALVLVDMSLDVGRDELYLESGNAVLLVVPLYLVEPRRGVYTSYGGVGYCVSKPGEGVVEDDWSSDLGGR